MHSSIAEAKKTHHAFDHRSIKGAYSTDNEEQCVKAKHTIKPTQKLRSSEKKQVYCLSKY